MIDSYRLFLGYELVDHGRLSTAQASLWGISNLTGRRYALMLPEGDGQTFLRFVEGEICPNYVPFRHMGWNSAELMVQDTDKAVAALAGSPFKIIGAPANLSISDKIRAAQVLGPANEALYLTSFSEKLPQFDTPEAKHFIDRVFIVILGGPSVQQVNAFYREHFGVAEAPVMPVVISVLSNAHGMPPDTRYDLAALPLQGQSYIEIDRMPATTFPRDARKGELPPAISMVTFGVEQLPAGLEWTAPPRALPESPYNGRRAALCWGAAGELIELIETST
ncbi:MAG: hypothetical protein FJ196_02120 [Gammaproteobacteria bacterium]|nr:hypothetical protein [Gammaproteobacteria bacterium]